LGPVTCTRGSSIRGRQARSMGIKYQSRKEKEGRRGRLGPERRGEADKPKKKGGFHARRGPRGSFGILKEKGRKGKRRRRNRRPNGPQYRRRGQSAKSFGTWGHDKNTKS